MSPAPAPVAIGEHLEGGGDSEGERGGVSVVGRRPALCRRVLAVFWLVKSSQAPSGLRPCLLFKAWLPTEPVLFISASFSKHAVKSTSGAALVSLAKSTCEDCWRWRSERVFLSWV